MRPVLHVELKNLGERLRKYLLEKIEERGPLTERELLEEALNFIMPMKRSLVGKLINLYKLRYGRKIGKNTAEKNLIKAYFNLLSDIKETIPHTLKPIYIGKKRIGRIFYVPGQEIKIREKVEGVLKKYGGRALELYRKLKEERVVRITPSYRRAAELLAYYGLGEIRETKFGRVIALPQTVLEEIQPSQEPTGGGGSIKIPVLVGRRLTYRTVSFDVFEVKDGFVVFGLKKEYVGLTDVKDLQRRALLTNLPFKLVVFCKEISKRAESFCKNWGIEIIKK